MKKRKHKEGYTPQVDEELDLHGYYGEEARTTLRDFLQHAREEEWQRVRIVVGKGTHSDIPGGVLPAIVKNELHAQGYTYTYAKQHEGGEGALEVRI